MGIGQFVIISGVANFIGGWPIDVDGVLPKIQSLDFNS